MKQKSIRALPIPAFSTYTPEIVAIIKQIPDEDIEYDESEIAWMRTALENLDYMLDHARRLGLTDSIQHILKWKVWAESAIARPRL